MRRALPDLSDPVLASVRTAYDEEARWIAYRRGDLRIAVNLSGKPAAIPLGAGRHRAPGGGVLAAWEPAQAPGGDGVLHLPPKSCMVWADD